jgi:hypothetical protein
VFFQVLKRDETPLIQGFENQLIALRRMHASPKVRPQLVLWTYRWGESIKINQTIPVPGATALR